MKYIYILFVINTLLLLLLCKLYIKKSWKSSKNRTSCESEVISSSALLMYSIDSSSSENDGKYFANSSSDISDPLVNKSSNTLDGDGDSTNNFSSTSNC